MKRMLLFSSILTISLGGAWFFLSSNTVGVYGVYYSGGPATVGGFDRTGSPVSGGATCTQCHGPSNANTTILFTLRDASNTVVSSYIGGETYTAEFQVTNPNYSLFGFQSVALTSDELQAGNFSTALTTQSQISTIGARQYPEHQTQSNTGIFQFTWVAPSSGDGNITIYAMGIAVNGSGSTGDEPSVPISAVITEQVITTIDYGSTEICSNNANIIPSINGTQNGTFSASPSGLSINTSTGEIDPAASSSGTYTITYTHADGTASETITINQVYNNFNTASICSNDSIFLAGAWQTTAGLYVSNFQSISNCDSTMNTDLTVITPNVETSDVGMTIMAAASGATYQWLDCEDNYAAITGEINQSFTATEDGFYAVTVTENGCTDTSECVSLGAANIQSSVNKEITLYPNPSDGVFAISGLTQKVTLRVFNSAGKLILSREINKANVQLDLTNETRGIYFIELGLEGGSLYKKLVLF